MQGSAIEAPQRRRAVAGLLISTVILVAGLAVSAPWLKEQFGIAAVVAVAAVLAIGVLGYALLFSIRWHRGLDEVERAGSGFATTWGSIAGQLLFPLVLMLPPFNALAIGLIERLTAGTVADPRMVTVAMAFAFGSVVLLQSIATLMLHVIWVASKR